MYIYSTYIDTDYIYIYQTHNSNHNTNISIYTPIVISFVLHTYIVQINVLAWPRYRSYMSNVVNDKPYVMHMGPTMSYMGRGFSWTTPI